MRIGVFCGSFSPVHNGHIEIINQCLKQGLVDKVIVIPTGPYWTKNNLLPLKDRVKMLKFFENDFIVIDEELALTQYTYQVFRKLGFKYIDDELVFIVGADNLCKFDEWEHYEELLKYDFIVVRRGKSTSKKIDERMAHFGKTNYVILRGYVSNVSSTFIRENFHDPDAIKGMLDDKVYDYIYYNKLI